MTFRLCNLGSMQPYFKSSYVVRGYSFFANNVCPDMLFIVNLDTLVESIGEQKFEEVIQLWWASSEMRGFHPEIMLHAYSEI